MAISNRFKLARHCDKVGQDIFAQASTESWPSQGQVGEAQEEIHCEKEGRKNHWKHTFEVVLV